jgi:hypothetical protein
MGRPGDPGKAYLPAFAKVLFDKVLHPAPGQIAGLVAALTRGVSEKHIVLHFNEGTLETLVTQLKAERTAATARATRPRRQERPLTGQVSGTQVADRVNLQRSEEQARIRLEHARKFLDVAEGVSGEARYFAQFGRFAA